MADPTQPKGPDNPSSDYQATADDLAAVAAIMGGATAMRAAGKKYLPKYPNESEEDYRVRCQKAPFTNIYVDVLRNLASKPFSKPVKLLDGAPSALVNLSENLDGRGSSLHVFAGDLFEAGINKGIDWIYVDYPKIPAGATLADERAINARPYWLHIPADRMLAVYSDFVDGEEIIVHARIAEDHIDRTGFEETVTKRVRMLDRARLVATPDSLAKTAQYAPATSTLWELQQPEDRTVPPQWVIIEGPLPITIGVIPLVPFITGERGGNGWAVTGPIRDIANLQMHEYRLESNLDHILDLTAFPMLAGNGVSPPTTENGVPQKVPVGPRAVLFAPPNGDGKHGEWKWIEPSADSIAKLMENLETSRKEMRELGMQPLLPKTGNLTATASAIASAKAHSAVQVWALTLQGALERGLDITAMWLGEQNADPDVHVHTDFGSGVEIPTELSTLIDMRRDNDLSQDTVWSELQRRGVLSDDFDPNNERVLIAANPAAPTENAIVPQISRP